MYYMKCSDQRWYSFNFEHRMRNITVYLCIKENLVLSRQFQVSLVFLLQTVMVDWEFLEVNFDLAFADSFWTFIRPAHQIQRSSYKRECSYGSTIVISVCLQVF